MDNNCICITNTSKKCELPLINNYNMENNKPLKRYKSKKLSSNLSLTNSKDIGYFESKKNIRKNFRNLYGDKKSNLFATQFS